MLHLLRDRDLLLVLGLSVPGIVIGVAAFGLVVLDCSDNGSYAEKIWLDKNLLALRRTIPFGQTSHW